MSSADVDDWLAECDDVLADWEGSGDSATWTADGSHEPDEIGGFYYAEDRDLYDPYAHARPNAYALIPHYHVRPHPDDPNLAIIAVDINLTAQQVQEAWLALQAAFAPVWVALRRVIIDATQNQYAFVDHQTISRPAATEPVDVTIREDTLRELVPLNLTQHASKLPPRPYPPFVAAQRANTSLDAQASTYGPRARRKDHP